MPEVWWYETRLPPARPAEMCVALVVAAGGE